MENVSKACLLIPSAGKSEKRKGRLASMNSAVRQEIEENAPIDVSGESVYICILNVIWKIFPFPNARNRSGNNRANYLAIYEIFDIHEKVVTWKHINHRYKGPGFYVSRFKTAGGPKTSAF